MKMNKFLIFSFFLVLSAAAICCSTGSVFSPISDIIEEIESGGNVVYVSANGSNLNSGTSADSPLASLNYALSVGKKIYVSSGNYEETIMITNMSNIEIYGGWKSDFTERNPENYPTLICPEGNGLSILISNSHYVFLGGLIVSNGYNPDTTLGLGGNILIRDSSFVTVETCKVIDGRAYYNGAGVCIKSSSDVTLKMNFIYSNRAAFSGTGGAGGGIYVSESERCFILSNRIQDNFAQSGGGIFIEAVSHVEISGNIVDSNEGNDDSGGIGVGGLFGDAYNVFIYDCDVRYNNATGSPSCAVRFYSGSQVRLLNSRIMSNDALSGILIDIWCSPSIVSNHIGFNGYTNVYENGSSANPSELKWNVFYTDYTAFLYYDGTSDIATFSISDVNSLDENGYNPSGSVFSNILGN